MSECVLIGGVFDPLHAGHLDYLEKAKEIADGRRVVCAVSAGSDKHPTLVDAMDRAEILRALGVDAFLHLCPTVAPFIRTRKPKAYIKGRDWDGKLPPEELRACQDVGAEVIYTDTMVSSSTKLLANYVRELNQEKLAAFERFVQKQAPVDKPWEPVTDYSWEAREPIERPHAVLIKETFAPRSVLDVGCGPGHLVRLLKELGVKARGVDLPKFDITWDVDVAEDFRYVSDLVICREVLEHMTVCQLAVAVRNLAKLSSKYVYVTTRFTDKPHLLDVDGSDGLDPTHISLLNQDLLRTLFVLEGCTRRQDLERRLDWQHKGRVLVYEVGA